MLNQSDDSSAPNLQDSADEASTSSHAGSRVDLKHFRACYLSASSPGYTGNPLIDALPVIRSDAEWAPQLLSAPEFDPRQREQEAHSRSYFVSELKHVFIPTAQHVKLARRLDQLIRWGYANRHPFSPERAALLQRSYANAQSSGKAQKLVFSPVDPISTFSLIGCSGVGKSTVSGNS